VLKDINWTIREGQRWHLQGANGASTLWVDEMLKILTISDQVPGKLPFFRF